ncbi:MAG: hypothetical protein SVV03_02370 [Candidatus Nanohaloarchaea archaeon]|nr:hypothetical protein [Candidatus Nanohaloarchaea archaeon]
MTVHRIEIVSSTDGPQQKVKNKISGLKSKYGEKLPKQNAPFDRTDLSGSTEHYRGEFIVSLTEKDKSKTKKDLTDQIEKELSKDFSWWRVRWHECNHDQKPDAHCVWNYENSGGSVPEGV